MPVQQPITSSAVAHTHRGSHVARHTRGPDTVEFVLASWRRSQQAGVERTAEGAPYLGVIDESRLLSCSQPVLHRLTESVAELGLSVALSDSSARVLARFDTDRRTAQALDAVELAPGFDYSEAQVGTNGVGTVLASGRGAHITSTNHFQNQFGNFTCSGAPIRNPLTGRIDGVLDLSGVVDDSCVFMHSLVHSAAREIEQALLDDRSVVQRTIFDAFLLTDARASTTVLAHGSSVSVANARAHLEFDADDQQAIRAQLDLLLERGRDEQLEVTLARGDRVRLQVTVVHVAGRAVGVVARVRRVSTRPRAVVTAQREPITSAGAQHAGAHEESLLLRSPSASTLSTTPAMIQACTELAAALAAVTPAMVIGEPGTGKLSMLKELSREVPEIVHTMVVTPHELAAGDERDLHVALSAIEGRALVVFRSVNELSSTGARRLISLHGRVQRGDYGEVQLAATSAPVDFATLQPDVRSVFDAFDFSVTALALRQRRDDIPRIVERMLAERWRGRPRVVEWTALRALVAYTWPGNLHELEQVISHVLRVRPSGSIRVDDLPVECLQQGTRTAGELERAERDTIITVLRSVQGNRRRAAEHLGISRSSLYRKLEAYGIRGV